MSSITSKRGFTLVETLVYGVGLVIILSGMVAFIFYLYGWYRGTTMPTRADNTGIALMHRIIGDVRSANQVNGGSLSIFGVQSGALSVKSVNGARSTTTRYMLDGGKLRYELNSEAPVVVSPDDIWISGFYVYSVNTDNSKAVRLKIDISYQTKSGTTTNSYTGLAILRQSYE